jgi:hypothetical protein
MNYNNNYNSIPHLCAESTATRPVTGTAQRRHIETNKSIRANYQEKYINIKSPYFGKRGFSGSKDNTAVVAWKETKWKIKAEAEEEY